MIFFNKALTLGGLQFDQAFRRIQTVKVYLRLHSITIGRKGLLFDQNSSSQALRALKTNHGEMQVHA